MTKVRSLTEKEHYTLQAIGRYYFLTAEQITRLCWGRSLTWVQTTVMPKLQEMNLVDKKVYTRSGPRGKEAFYYTLTQAGRRYCTDRGMEITTRYRPSEYMTREHMHHTIRVNDFLISMVLLGRHVPEVRPRTVTHERDFKRSPIKLPDGSVYAPDALTVLEIDGVAYAFLLEMDLGTEGQDQWKEKIRRLWLYLDHLHPNAWPMVCVVSPGSVTRRANLQSWTLDLTQVPDVFYFTDADPASDPRTLFFSPIWYELRSLYPCSLIQGGGG